MVIQGWDQFVVEAKKKYFANEEKYQTQNINVVLGGELLPEAGISLSQNVFVVKAIIKL